MGGGTTTDLVSHATWGCGLLAEPHDPRLNACHRFAVIYARFPIRGERWTPKPVVRGVQMDVSMVVLVLDDIRWLGPPCLAWHRLAHHLQIELGLVERLFLD